MRPVALLAVLALAILVLVLMKWANKRRANIDYQFFTGKWEEIRELCQQSPAHWTAAIIEADKLVDEALKQCGYAGKTMGERLVSANRAFSDADAIWSAHKIRNRIVHEANAKLNKGSLSMAMRGFRKALKDLGVL